MVISCSTKGDSRLIALSDENEYRRYYGLDQLSGEFESKIFRSGVFNIWSWEQTPDDYRATLVILHGYLDHSALSLDLYKYLTEQKYRIILMDLPGHGLSSGERAGLNDFHDYELCLKDFIEVWELVPEETFFIGHSTGASILIDALLNGENMKGAVLAAPLFQFRHWDSVKSFIKVLKKPDLRLPVSTRPSTSNQAFTEKKKQDPLYIDTFPLNWPLSIIKWVQERSRMESVNLSPIIIMQGEKDHVVYWERNIPIIEQWFPHSSTFYYPDLKHHLFNETRSIIIYQEINRFIENQL